MNKLTANDLIKLGSVSKKAKAFIMHLAKVAAGDSEFDETPPAMNTEQLEADKASRSSQDKEQAAPAAIPAEEEGVPVEQPMPTQEGPEAVGARAAQSFIGPEIMQAAMSGDPGAADLVARTAGQIAGAVSEAMLRSSQQAPVEQMGGAGIPATGDATMAPAITTPEEDLANEIVPPQAEPPITAPGSGGQAPTPASGGQAPASDPGSKGPRTPEGEGQGKIDNGKAPETKVNPEPGSEGQGGEGKVDAKDIQKLLELARAGKI